MSEKILITSALPYANGPLHFGHIAGAYLPADCYARFQRLQKNDVFYVCGSDEYGIAITLSAEIAGREPQEHVDLFHAINRAFFDKLNIAFDHYSRTTWKGHKETTQQYFKDLLDNGFIDERVTDQLYSEDENKFLADRYVSGTCPRCGFIEARGDECQKCGASYEATDLKNPRSKLSGLPLVHRPTKHWFLLLDKFKEPLKTWLETKQWKPNVVNFVKGYIDELRPRAITRDMTWGIPIPLPETEGKVLYVWFDAPIGYISATKEWALKLGTPERWKDYWCDPKTKLVNFIGKDNIPFHAVIFPAMTMGQNQPYKLVDELPANEFYNLEGKKFSKSDGWYIDLESFFKSYTADQIRYTIAANAPETADSEFTWKDFQMRCNTDLLGKFGNLVNRVLVFAKHQCASEVPKQAILQVSDIQFLNDIRKLLAQAKTAYETFKIRRASQLMMELAQLGNVYFDAKRPWQDAKQPETKQVMQTTIACCLECLKALALIAAPLIPDSSARLWEMLGYKEPLDQIGWEGVISHPIPVGQRLKDPHVLFIKIEDQQIDQEICALKKQSEEQGSAQKAISFVPLKEPIGLEEVRKLDLRIGTVISAESVVKSKKLLKLQVDLGFEKRTIVSGISQSYPAEQIIGKKVVVVANLKPALLMGIESQGMLLCASWEASLEVIGIQNLPNGSAVS